eukprot:2448590-Pleurochrysis_carterae.AAC.1
MLANTRRNTPEASLFGIRLTEDTYRRLKSNNCPTATPATLPEEFRRRNRRALVEAAQHRAAAEGEGTSDVTPGGATLPTDPPLESRHTEASGDAGGTVENMEDAESEAEVSGGLDGGEDEESGDQAEHASQEADDAKEHSSSAEASDAEGG